LLSVLAVLEQVGGTTGREEIMGQTLQVLVIPQLAVAVAEQKVLKLSVLLEGQEAVAFVVVLVVLVHLVKETLAALT
jgi:hypothetical protein